MKQRTRELVRTIQDILCALDHPKLHFVLDTALSSLTESDLDYEDAVRFRLGWTVVDENGQRYAAWPESGDESFLVWEDPDPDEVVERIRGMDAAAFYHDVLQIFSYWPELPAMHGYEGLQSLAEWLKAYGEEDDASAPGAKADWADASLSPRKTTAELMAGATVPLGDCGDAWKLSACGDELDVMDHRPYAGNSRTPVGVCADAPVLVLYPERGAVDWPQVLGHTLRKGRLFSGAEIWVVYLRDQDWRCLMEEVERMQVTKDHIAEWLAHDADGFAQCQAHDQARIRDEATSP